MSEGYILLYRKLQNNSLWTSEPFTRGQAWVDLILLANHEVGYFYCRDHKIEVKRGQVGLSQNKLASRWKWSRTKVRKFLDDLEKEQQIKQLKSRSYTVIELINYEKYQPEKQQKNKSKTRETRGERRENEETKGNREQEKNGGNNQEIEKIEGFENQKNNRKTTGKQEQDNRKTQTMNDKRMINKKRVSDAEASDVFPDACEFLEEATKLANHLKNSIVARRPDHKFAKNPPSLNRWIYDIEKLIRLDGKDPLKIEKLISYTFFEGTEKAEFWAPNINSGEKLRKHYDLMAEQYIKEIEGKTFTYDGMIDECSKKGLTTDNFKKIGENKWRKM